MKFNEIPKSIQKRLSKSFLFMLLVAVITAIIAISMKDWATLIVGTAIIAYIGITFMENYLDVKNNKYDVFEGTCIEINRTIKKSIKQIVVPIAKNNTYVLQGKNKTVEIIVSSPLHLYKGQKYRFYFSRGLIERKNEEVIKVYNYYGYEMI